MPSASGVGLSRHAVRAGGGGGPPAPGTPGLRALCTPQLLRGGRWSRPLSAEKREKKSMGALELGLPSNPSCWLAALLTPVGAQSRDPRSALPAPPTLAGVSLLPVPLTAAGTPEAVSRGGPTVSAHPAGTTLPAVTGKVNRGCSLLISQL